MLAACMRRWMATMRCASSGQAGWASGTRGCSDEGRARLRSSKWLASDEPLPRTSTM